ncbi:MAG: tryptophan synthase subunit alpha [Flavobacteriales bacterium]|nr:tryptophan synthase subunit alpha [Flavobacteriales bacterium]
MNSTGQYVRDRNRLLSIYITSEYPNAGDTTKSILALESSGVDMIEVGIPFSDPLADGPVIQESSMQALVNGFKLAKLFEDLKQIREEVSIPLVPMGYFNTVLQYGVELFLKQCEDLAIDTVILPDLPIEQYKYTYRPLFKQYGVCPVFLISPRTEKERIREIDDLSESFIYMVADNSITGAKDGLSDSQEAYFERIKEMGLRSPIIIGFGISDKNSFDTATRFANGAIIGSAFIRAVSGEGDLEEKIQEFVNNIR